MTRLYVLGGTIVLLYSRTLVVTAVPVGVDEKLLYKLHLQLYILQNLFSGFLQEQVSVLVCVCACIVSFL